jgi:hypothetical protein
MAVSVVDGLGENTGGGNSTAHGVAHLTAKRGASRRNIREIPAIGCLVQHDLIERRASDADTDELDVARLRVRY